MRILFTKQLPLDAPGGEASHLLALANQMRAMGVDVFLMPVTGHSTPDGIWPVEFIREVRPFGLHRVFDSFSISKAAADFVKEIPVDAVLSWQYETAYLSNFTDTRNFVHGVVAAAPFGLLKRKANANFLRSIAYSSFHFRQLHQAQVIYCPSEFAKSELVNYIGIEPEKIVTTYLSADAIFKPSHEKKTGPLKNFIFSGSFIPLKGIFDALEALGIINQRGYTDWVFKIIGWGDETAVRKAAHKNGIESHVHFMGRLDRSALAHELASADLAILPSHTDNFGLSIIESEACGLPVVSYRMGGIPEEVMEGKTAILVELFNHTALANAIIHLINDPQNAREMGQRGSRFVRDRFSWQKTAEKMLESIQALRSKKGMA
jgi:glycosyltransferase involved in cell wall biosynthesis